MSPSLVRGAAGTAGMTSSSGSAVPFRMTSISPVEKPVTREIEVEIQGSQLGQLQLQDIEVPARPERDLVVGDPQCALLRLAQPRYVMVGTSARPMALAAMRRPWPAIMRPSGSVRIGFTKPNCRMDATI